MSNLAGNPVDRFSCDMVKLLLRAIHIVQSWIQQRAVFTDLLIKSRCYFISFLIVYNPQNGIFTMSLSDSALSCGRILHNSLTSSYIFSCIGESILKDTDNI